MVAMGKKQQLADDEENCCYGVGSSEAECGVDAEFRATDLRPLSLLSPHTQAFHLAWLSLFACFFAAFAAPPILPALRPALVLAPSDAPAAAVGSLSATLVGRLAMGPACDLLGPRRASGFASLLAALAVAVTAVTASSPAGFVALRFVAGLSLANFVANQHWMSGIFAPSAVGLANAVTAGWANVGSAAAQLVMPLAYELVLRLGVPITVAWRVTYLLPCALLITTGLAVLAFPYDLPRGAGVGGGAKTGKSLWKVVRGGVSNYRAWVLALTYGYCYGVELIMENVAADFFRKRFHLPMEAAGAAAACFGAMNAVARPAGGLASDAVARLFGMRGRLWLLWAVQTTGAALCVLVGRMGAAEAPSLAATMAVMVLCAAFVQASSGLTFGIVPFVSKRSLGVVSGMTASGGAVGAIVTNRLFFSGSRYTIEEAISLTGAASLVCTLPLALVHFPRHGGMLCGPTAVVDGDDAGYDNDNSAGDYTLLK
ncbi:probable high-affinity nitrate transporter 2.4 [Zea mays]|uniref:High affinity nitrate transporter 2.7 n=2 Tax=Zea mays TaxID=4577 RepID=A0A1D6NMM6_MAIZE|nr:probable high-affinity nitrate transporter 2.4 [Zea mays]ONM41423.1 High affinity nitrate transporter 2.7 [Zea mays]|eukprot:XP_020406190.1 probable high-affinity nitrate transporter 2.4 [Zea mays]